MKYLPGICLALSTITVANIANADTFLALDPALPESVDAESIAPVFDFDTDGCLPSAGISRTGEKNGGLKPSGDMAGDCRDSNFLETSNTVHRYTCKSTTEGNFCGHIYSLYFQKDQLFNLIESGHRHDWEFAIVYTKDGVATHASYSSHGDIFTTQYHQAPTVGGKPKVVYHKDGITTHVLRFAKTDEAAENEYGQFVTPPIISWFEMYGDGVSNSQLRQYFNTYNYGSANVPVSDGNFLNNLNEGKPDGYPAF